MRLGASQSILNDGSLSKELYGGVNTITERHRHRYEFNSNYREKFEAAGMVIASTSVNEGLVEIVELKDHPYYVAAQFHPEFLSKPNKPHPLFSGFVEAALKNSKID